MMQSCVTLLRPRSQSNAAFLGVNFQIVAFETGWKRVVLLPAFSRKLFFQQPQNFVIG